MTATDIHSALKTFGGYKDIYVPEFTWREPGHEMRVDCLIIDTGHRWIRGFEIKTDRADFLRDVKWPLYSQCCSSLSIVCPAGLIQPAEVEGPFGLVWVLEDSGWQGKKAYRATWKKRPKNFQKRNSLAWLWIYVRVLEMELPRLQVENSFLRTTKQGS